MRRIRADRRVGLLLGGVVLLTFVAVVATVLLPASDPALRARGQAPSALVRRGMRLYAGEGCWYCHTTYRRDTSVDLGGGERATTAAEVAGRSPALLGVERIGPDLAGEGLATKADVVAYLERAHGVMPSYGYLSRSDLEALAAFLLSIR